MSVLITTVVVRKDVLIFVTSNWRNWENWWSETVVGKELQIFQYFTLVHLKFKVSIALLDANANSESNYHPLWNDLKNYFCVQFLQDDEIFFFTNNFLWNDGNENCRLFSFIHEKKSVSQRVRFTRADLNVISKLFGDIIENIPFPTYFHKTIKEISRLMIPKRPFPYTRHCVLIKYKYPLAKLT